MRILVHDYAGHPFQVQLSRELASRGHHVHHAYCGSVVTPRGRLVASPEDPPTFSVEGLSLPRKIQKYSYVHRWLQDRAYGRLLAEKILSYKPDVVLSANTPLDSLGFCLKACRRAGARHVFWLQDVYSMAVERLIGRNVPLIGPLITWWYKRLERSLLRASDAVVLITEDFRATLAGWSIDPGKVFVIPNWAPLDEVWLTEKDNPWSKAHGLDSQYVFMYTGTLGMKHDPSMLVELANEFSRDENVRVVVVSEGLGADYLKREKESRGLRNLVFLPYQSFSEMPNMLGTADVLIALLEQDAGMFSVPSKVLTYHCAGRALLLAVPSDNLASRIVRENASGLLVEPGEREAFLKSARELYENPKLCSLCGSKARAYAEKTFHIETIGTQFEEILQSALR